MHRHCAKRAARWRRTQTCKRVPLRHTCGAWPGSFQRGLNLVPIVIIALRGKAAQRVHDWGSVVLVESIAEIQLADGARPLLNALFVWRRFPFIEHLQQESAPRGAVWKASCTLYEIGDGGGEEDVRIPLQLMHNHSCSAPPECRATTQRPDVNAIVLQEREQEAPCFLLQVVGMEVAIDVGQN